MERTEHPLSRAICAAIIVGALAYFGLHLALDRHALGAPMNAQQEAVALYLHWERRGFEPSVRSISRALRDQGVKFRESDLRLWMRPFLEKANSRDASRPQPPASGGTGTQETSTGDAVGRTDLGPDATGTRLRAHPKVPLVSNNSRSGGARKALTATEAGAFAAGLFDIAVAAGMQAKLGGRRDEWAAANAEAAIRLEYKHGADGVSAAWAEVVDDVAVGHLKPPRALDLAYLIRLWPSIERRARDVARTSLPDNADDREKALANLDPGVAGVLRRLPG